MALSFPPLQPIAKHIGDGVLQTFLKSRLRDQAKQWQRRQLKSRSLQIDKGDDMQGGSDLWPIDWANGLHVGARWDDTKQTVRFQAARSRGLIKYAEVNFPISPLDNIQDIQIPILAHTSENPLCSSHGLNYSLAEMVRQGAIASNSPWVGEHVSFSGSDEIGALGYVINPLFIADFAATAVANIRQLSAYYEKPLALELGPLYTPPSGDFRSELDFLNYVAEETNSKIILDLAHWTISNRNLGRSADFGLTHLSRHRIIELHIAGIRKGGGNIWHDSHGESLDQEVLELTGFVLKYGHEIRAITLEHSFERPEEDFFRSLDELHMAIVR
jgi:uncharacterized protein (UPF0276 family)